MSLKITPEANKPLPDDFDSEEPSAFVTKVKVAAATAKVLLEAGAEIPISSQEKAQASDIFKAYTDPNATPPSVGTKILNTPATVAHLVAMLSDYDHQVVEEAVQLRRYVTNKLIEETSLPNPAHRIKALELLGKISDVGLFTEKTEVTIKNAGVEDLESQIRGKLFKILNASQTIDAPYQVIEKEMGEFNPQDVVKDLSWT